MFYQTVIPLFLALSSLSSAQPVEGQVKRWGGYSQQQFPVPLSNGDNGTLPAPKTSLKAITLGRGTQNYTCSSASAKPKSVGAKATLWDMTHLLSLPYPANINAIEEFPRVAVNIADAHIPLASNAQVIGKHFFNAAGVPIFDLGDNGFLAAKKKGDIPAPKGSSTGPLDTPGQDFGAVDWLALVDVGNSTKLSEVYRVDCAGGNPPKTCAGEGHLEQQYSCLYWFFN